jgi:glycosyltransferase involved in cell wall biosynthesis
MLQPKIGVIIPARNEEDSIARVLRDIPAELSARVVVVNNRSTDRTAEIARAHGAVVLDEDRPGYGRCIK